MEGQFALYIDFERRAEQAYHGDDIAEELGGIDALLVAALPQVALEVFDVADLDITLREILNVGLQGFWAAAVLGRKGIAEGHEVGVVPLGLDDFRQCFEGVRELRVLESTGGQVENGLREWKY